MCVDGGACPVAASSCIGQGGAQFGPVGYDQLALHRRATDARRDRLDAVVGGPTAWEVSCKRQPGIGLATRGLVLDFLELWAGAVGD